MSKTPIAHRAITYTRPASFRLPGGRETLDIYVYDNGDVKLYLDLESRPATLTREEWAKLVEKVESVELPEPETTKDVVESSESVAIATDV